MFGSIARKLFGSANERVVKGLRKRVEVINALAQALDHQIGRAHV